MSLNKVITVLKSPNSLKRLLQVINKSPFKHLTKGLAILKNQKLYLDRKRIAEQTSLSESEVRILDSLRENGWVDISQFIDPRQLEQLLAYSTPKLEKIEEIKKNQLVTTKSHWVRVSDEAVREGELNSENPMVQLALDPKVLKVVAKYLTTAPFLDDVLLTYSQFSGDQLQSSQLWHQDQDNPKMLKIFVYLTDVQSDLDGPFTFMDQKTSLRVRNGFFMNHLKDEEIHQYVKPNEVLKMIKPKLSCFLVNTNRCYHMGSRVKQGHSRFMYTGLYIGLPSNYPWAGKEKISISESSQLDQLQQTALRQMS